MPENEEKIRAEFLATSMTIVDAHVRLAKIGFDEDEADALINEWIDEERFAEKRALI